jgi:restriction system protein
VWVFAGIGGLALVSWLLEFARTHALATSAVGVSAVAAGAGWAYLRWTRAVRLADRERNVVVTDGMTGPEFEKYVARLMRGSGFKRVKTCGGGGDLGADVVGYTPDGRRVVVQCKRYAGSVGGPLIQMFNGTARDIHAADVALFVTTGRPTTQARQLAARCGIVLVDRPALATWITTGAPPIAGWPYRREPPPPAADGELQPAPDLP